MRHALRSLAVMLCLSVPAARAQDSARGPVADASRTAHVPWGVGERMEYDIRFGKLHVGSGDMEVLPMDTVRGRDTWHTVFRVSGGIPFYHVNDRYEGWFDSQTLSSLRYWQDIDEGNYEPKRHYEIFPDRREYIEGKKEPQASVDHPLDDGSFLYFLRTVRLHVGMDTSFNDYFKADRNPVRIKVLRKDTIDVPAGRFSAIVVQPAVNTTGLFSEGGEALIWLSDDENHVMLQLKSKLKIGSLNLYLKSYRPSPSSRAPLNKLTPSSTHQ